MHQRRVHRCATSAAPPELRRRGREMRDKGVRRRCAGDSLTCAPKLPPKDPPKAFDCPEPQQVLAMWLCARRRHGRGGVSGRTPRIREGAAAEEPPFVALRVFSIARGWRHCGPARPRRGSRGERARGMGQAGGGGRGGGARAGRAAHAQAAGAGARAEGGGAAHHACVVGFDARKLRGGAPAKKAIWGMTPTRYPTGDARLDVDRGGEKKRLLACMIVSCVAAHTSQTHCSLSQVSVFSLFVAI